MIYSYMMRVSVVKNKSFSESILVEDVVSFREFVRICSNHLVRSSVKHGPNMIYAMKIHSN